MKKLADCSITIIGLGLMGGSLAGAMRNQCQTIIGVDKNPEAIKSALSFNFIDSGTTEVLTGVKNSDVVILATPVRVILRLLDDIGPLLPDGCLIMDLGSTKSKIVNKMASLPEHIQTLGGHPMCGREVSGITAADPAIYCGCTFVITPHERTSSEAVFLGREIITTVGAIPLVLDADYHDQLVASISHLPYLLSCGLVGEVDFISSEHSVIRKLTSNGFRDTTRLAVCDVTMMLDILLTNQEAVIKALQIFESQIQNLANLIKSGNERGLHAALSTLRESRQSYFT